MKLPLLLCFICLSTIINAEPLMHYRDTANHFSIGIPMAWHYVANPYPGIKLMVNRVTPASDTTDKSRENFNINIIEESSSNLAGVYNKLVAALKSTANFTLLGQGDTILAGKHFKWLKEAHKNDLKINLEMENYDFIAYENGRSYILTFTTLSSSFKRFEDVFNNVAQSFSISSENIALEWPKEDNFKVIANLDEYPSSTLQMLPAKETADQWTILATVITLKTLHVPSIDDAVKIYTQQAVQSSPVAKCTVLGSSNEPGKQYALFKIETSSFHNSGTPDSQIYYVRQGQENFFTCMIEVKQPVLSKALVDKWSAIFMGSKLYNE